MSAATIAPRLSASVADAVTGSNLAVEEQEKLAGELLGSLLGHVMAGVDRDAAHVGRPVAPDRDHVAVQLLHVVERRPPDQHRARDPRPARLILDVGGAV